MVKKKVWIVLMVMAMRIANCHAQMNMDVVPDMVEAITRVVKADDCQKAIQILGEYGFMPGYIDKPSGALFFDMDAGIMHGYAYLCPALENREKIGMVRIGSNYNLMGVIQKLEMYGMELSRGGASNVVWCQWGELHGSLTVMKSRREYEIEFRLRPYKH